jgi:hypothetical protein
MASTGAISDSTNGYYAISGNYLKTGTVSKTDSSSILKPKDTSFQRKNEKDASGYIKEYMTGLDKSQKN